MRALARCLLLTLAAVCPLGCPYVLKGVPMRMLAYN